jgi:hypothetical protein
MDSNAATQELLSFLRAAVGEEGETAPWPVSSRESTPPRSWRYGTTWSRRSGSGCWEAMDPDDAAELLSKLSWKEQPELLEALTPSQVTQVLEELDPDDLADTLQALEDWDPERTEEVRALLDPEILAIAESLSEYDEEEAGGLMTPDFVSVRATMTARTGPGFLREASPDAETIYYLYVVDDLNRLKGVLSLRELIVSQPDTRVSEMMDTHIIAVGTETDQEEVARSWRTTTSRCFPWWTRRDAWWGSSPWTTSWTWSPTRPRRTSTGWGRPPSTSTTSGPTPGSSSGNGRPG